MGFWGPQGIEMCLKHQKNITPNIYNHIFNIFFQKKYFARNIYLENIFSKLFFNTLSRGLLCDYEIFAKVRFKLYLPPCACSLIFLNVRVNAIVFSDNVSKAGFLGALTILPDAFLTRWYVWCLSDVWRITALDAVQMSIKLGIFATEGGCLLLSMTNPASTMRMTKNSEFPSKIFLK